MSTVGDLSHVISLQLPNLIDSQYTSMPRVSLEPTTTVFERAKTVYALDRATTVIVVEYNTAKCMGVCVTKITGSSSDDWVYWHFGYSLS
jgi:hypothetical protein